MRGCSHLTHPTPNACHLSSRLTVSWRRKPTQSTAKLHHELKIQLQKAQEYFKTLEEKKAKAHEELRARVLANFSTLSVDEDTRRHSIG